MRAKGFTLVETLVSLVISIVALGAGIQSTRVAQRSSQLIADQLVMSGLADEALVNLQVLRFRDQTALASSSRWMPLYEAINAPTTGSFSLSGSPVSYNGQSGCDTNCNSPIYQSGPIVLKWFKSTNSGYVSSFIGPDKVPVCTTWMAKSPNCDQTSYSYTDSSGGTSFHQDTIGILRSSSGNTTGGEVYTLASRLSADSQNDSQSPLYQKEFFDEDISISSLSSSKSQYSVKVTLTNHADPTITYTKSQMLADLP